MNYILCFYTQVLHEIPSTAQWCFDVQWCPRNPAMISIGSFDGCISIHSLMGGSCMSETVTKQQQDVVGYWMLNSLFQRFLTSLSIISNT